MNHIVVSLATVFQALPAPQAPIGFGKSRLNYFRHGVYMFSRDVPTELATTIKSLWEATGYWKVI